MRNSEFKAIIGDLSGAYDKILNESRSSQYFDAFGHFPADIFRAAVERAKRECEFFPTIAALHIRVKEMMELSGALLSAERAWERTCAVIDAHYRPGKGDDLIPYPNEGCRIAARSIGGFVRIADANTKSREFMRAEFMRHYEAVCMSAEVVGALVSGARAPRRYIAIPTFRLEPGQLNPATGLNEGRRVCWDTVEQRPAAIELYELQERIMGGDDGRTAIAGGSVGGYISDGRGAGAVGPDDRDDGGTR